MSDDRTEKPQEIVVVRRRGGDDAAAVKGGAWKIAYADFVTAMMAFFLVMWLINASNEETRAQVASYFNPIKLTDSSTGDRGLKDRRENKTTQKGETDATAGGTPPSASDIKHEADVLANPDKHLSALEAKVAAMESTDTELAAAPGSGSESIAANGLATDVNDPFDPRTSQPIAMNLPPGPSGAVTEKDTAPAPTGVGKPMQTGPQTPIDFEEGRRHQKTIPETSRTKVAILSVNKLPDERSPVVHAPDNKLHGKNKHETQPIARVPLRSAALNTRDSEAAVISAELAAKLGTGLDDLKASIDIKKTDEGTLISLTDKQSFGMFRSGSAEPQPELVRLVGAIADVIARRKGYIVVRGHTDSKPYRIKKYDNWQLSSARAHLAQYMLVRGGVDVSRIRRIEGLADRDPKNPGDPQAPENRRIEILLGPEES